MTDTPITTTTTPTRGWRIAVGILIALVVAVCGTVLAADAEWINIFWIMMAFWPLILLGVGWLILTGIGWVKYRTWRSALVAPIIVLGTAALLKAGMPHHASFVVSRGALTEAAAQCEDRRGDRWIGTVRVEKSTRLPDGICAFTTGGFIDSVGWAYVPDGVAPESAEKSGYYLRPYEGPWHRFTWDF